MMQIIFLGTGTILPFTHGGKIRSYSAILIKIGRENLLFDAGPGTLVKLQTLGINPTNWPNYVFLTHYHLDHCLDYLALVKSRWFNYSKGNLKKGKTLKVFGPSGLKQWNHQIFRKVDKWNYLSGDLDYLKVTKLTEVNEGLVIKKKNWKVHCCPVEHYNGVAFRIESAGKSFVYSGDMTYDERFSKLGNNADVAAIECSFPDKKSLIGKHLEPEMVGKLSKLGNFKTVVLTHLYPATRGKEKKMIGIIKKISGKKVILAHDFKKICI